MSKHHWWSRGGVELAGYFSRAALLLRSFLISAVLSSVFGFRFLGASCATKKALGIPPLNASPPQERERGAGG